MFLDYIRKGKRNTFNIKRIMLIIIDRHMIDRHINYAYVYLPLLIVSFKFGELPFKAEQNI